MFIDLLPEMNVQEPTPNKSTKLPVNSYVKNCYIKHRVKTGDIESPFFCTSDAIYATLDGYAIIPKEEYNDLVKQLSQWKNMKTQQKPV